MAAYLAFLRDEFRAALGALGLPEAPLDGAVDRALLAGMRRLSPVLGAVTVDVEVPAGAVEGLYLDLGALVDDFGQLRQLRYPVDGAFCQFEALSRTQIAFTGVPVPQAGAVVRLTYVQKLQIEGLRGATATNFDETVEPAVIFAALAEFLEDVADGRELLDSKAAAGLRAASLKVWDRAVRLVAYREPAVISWAGMAP